MTLNGGTLLRRLRGFAGALREMLAGTKSEALADKVTGVLVTITDIGRLVGVSVSIKGARCVILVRLI